MYEWGELERQLLYLFHILTNTKWAIARIIFSIGFRAPSLSKIFRAIGKLRLKESEQITLKELCKNYTTIAERRNKIVHGLWDIEHDKNNTLGQWTRIYYPTDPEKEKRIFDKFDQIDRIKYRHTIKQLQTASSEVHSLTNEMADFTRSIIKKYYLEEQS